jgi:hypothetical protein
MVVQRLVNRRGLANDRDPQPDDLRDNLGVSVALHSQIVSPHPARVKVGRPLVQRRITTARVTASMTDAASRRDSGADTAPEDA